MITRFLLKEKKNWIKCQGVLAPGQSPLTSFIYHPNFKMAASLADFHRREEAGLDKIRNLGTKRGMISEVQVVNRVGFF